MFLSTSLNVPPPATLARNLDAKTSLQGRTGAFTALVGYRHDIVGWESYKSAPSAGPGLYLNLTDMVRTEPYKGHQSSSSQATDLKPGAVWML